MSTEKLNTAVRQEQIAQATLSIVASQGLKGLSVAAVAEHVGIVPSAIYRHFRSKEDVLGTALDLIRDKLYGNIKAVCDESPEAMDRLHCLLIRHLRMIEENEAIPRIVFSEDVYDANPERKLRLRSIVTGYLDRVAEIIRQGQREGQVCADVDAQAVSMMFLGMIQPAVILWNVSEGRFDMTRHAESAWLIFSGAIKAR